MKIGIIGAGASGMAAAIAAAENPEHEVLLLERQARVGRKLQATGNGRCNLTNIHTALQHYHGEQETFPQYALEQYPVENTLDWFRKLGLYTVEDAVGKVYPYSDQANSVVDVLRFGLNRPNIQLITGCEVTRIRKHGTEFMIETGENSYVCHRVIVACGGLAGSKLGGSMSGYKLLRGMGHRVTKLRPNLVQLKVDWSGISALKGVRANCHVRINHGENQYAHSTGEIQFTEFGLSGPVIFEISRDVCQADGSWNAVLDFLPEWEEADLMAELCRRRAIGYPVDELLTGILHNRLGRTLTQAAGIRANREIEHLSNEKLAQVCRNVKEFELTLTEPLGMDAAQVTAGGVMTAEFHPQTLESKLVPGLFACGEVLDVDGDCGGYNLQWAWSSGRLAGTQAGKEML